MTCIDPQTRCFLFILLTLTVLMTLTSDSDINSVHSSENRELVGVDNWFKTNRLSLNINKTSYMIISNQKNALEIKIRELIFTKVSTVKFLGVTLDENLTFKDNVNKVTSKGKVFYGQEPPSRESTTTESGVNYQLLSVMH